EMRHQQQPELQGLVGDTGEHRDGKSERALRPPQIGGIHVLLRLSIHLGGRRVGHAAPYSAALRMASHSRSAWASRGVTSGNCGSSPTAGVIFHERAHLRPCANCGTTATPATSGSRKASDGPSPSINAAPEVMHNSARSASTTVSNRSRSET